MIRTRYANMNCNPYFLHVFKGLWWIITRWSMYLIHISNSPIVINFCGIGHKSSKGYIWSKDATLRRIASIGKGHHYIYRRMRRCRVSWSSCCSLCLSSILPCDKHPKKKIITIIFRNPSVFFLPFEKTIMGPKKERRLSWMSRGRACFIKGSTRGANRDYNTVQSCTILKTEDEALIYIYQPIEKQLSSILSHQNEYIYIWIDNYLHESQI